jgi:zinc D-Ala-D-Ala carboxypeptidase
MRTLKLGDTGDDVRELQQLLIDTAGSMDFEGEFVVDGIFGPMTEFRVKSFQSRQVLVEDGIVGPKTMASLKKAYEMMQEQRARP